MTRVKGHKCFHFKKARGAVNLGWTSKAYLFQPHKNKKKKILDTTAVVLDKGETKCFINARSALIENAVQRCCSTPQ